MAKEIEEKRDDGLYIGGELPVVGSIVRVETRYGTLDGTVSSNLTRLNGQWLAYVKPQEYPVTMQTNALWEINSLNVPWLMIKVGERVVVEATTDDDSPVSPSDCAENISEQISLDSVKTFDDLIKLVGDEGSVACAASTEGRIEKLILSAIKSIGSSSRSDVIEATKISEVEWTETIALLVKQNKVVKTGAKRGTRYQIS
jgi:hypothetical protein